MNKHASWFDRCRFFAALLVQALYLLAVLPAAAQPLQLGNEHASVDAWPALAVLIDPTSTLTLADVLSPANAARFKPPGGVHATLGLNNSTAWIRIPLAVDARSDGLWILSIDYPPLNTIDVHLVAADGRIVQQALLGSLRPYSERPLPGRIHAVPLHLLPGETSTLYLRVQTQGGMVLPIRLEKLPAFTGHGLDEQLLQGLLGGLGVCLLLYSLMQWITMRDSLYLKYALQTSGSVVFSIYQFGLGEQYLWSDNHWAQQHLGGLSALIASAGSFLFVDHALGPHRNRWFGPLMKTGCVVLLLVGAAHSFNMVGTHLVTAVVGTIGLVPALAGLPGAIRRALRGDPIGWLFLMAWVGYFFSTWVMVGLITGSMPFNFWTQHSLQFGATLDMLLFMRVIGLRHQELHLAAQRARQERESLVTLAHTDALTGLPNRRSLDQALQAALRECSGQRLVALFVLDLDGFKQVNDTHGHIVGDQLLVEVARRLRGTLRGEDVVARVGGDEFVVVVRGLLDEQAAHKIGEHLLAAFGSAFVLPEGRECRMGLTIGYALAPLDGLDAATLVRRADTAMYAGKQGGKLCLMRSAALAT